MSDPTLSRLIREWEYMEAIQSPHKPLWQELSDYILPRRADITTKRFPAQKAPIRLFDSTAPHANELLASTFSGTLTPESERWFSLRMQNEELNEEVEVAEWLHVCSTRMFSALNQSNFSAENHENYLDLGCFGITGLVCTEKSIVTPTFNGLVFKAHQVGDFVIAEDEHGRVNQFGRNLNYTLAQAVRAFGEGAFDESTIAKYKANPHEKANIKHMVMPRGPEETDIFSEEFDFSSYYIDFDKKRLLSKGGFHEFPGMFPRWTKVAGDIYGYSQGYIALPDIRSLNKSRELSLRALAKHIDPPLLVRDDGVIGQVNTGASMPTIIRGDPNTAVVPMQSGGKYDIVQVEEQMLVQSILKIFYADLVAFLDKKYMTAMEVEKQLEMMYRRLGPVIGRLVTEYLAPLINRVFMMMLRRGAFPPIPEVLIMAHQAGQGDIDVVYEGPLAKAQRGGSLAAIEKAYALWANIAAVQPEIMDIPNATKIGRFIGQASGLPNQLMNDQKEIDKRRAGRVEDAEAEAAQQAAASEGQVAKDVAQADATMKQGAA